MVALAALPASNFALYWLSLNIVPRDPFAALNISGIHHIKSAASEDIHQFVFFWAILMLVLWALMLVHASRLLFSREYSRDERAISRKLFLCVLATTFAVLYFYVTMPNDRQFFLSIPTPTFLLVSAALTFCLPPEFLAALKPGVKESQILASRSQD